MQKVKSEVGSSKYSKKLPALSREKQNQNFAFMDRQIEWSSK